MAVYFTLRSLATTCIFVLSTPVAVISATVGRLSWLAIPVAYVVIGRLLHARVPRNLCPSI